MYDVMIIGAGPAGLSAAVNVRQRGGSALVVGLSNLNNPLYKAERLDNYLGMYGVTGKEMLEIFEKHAQDMGVDFNQNRVLNTMFTGTSWMVSAGSDVLEAKALIFAGGIMRGKPYPGEEAYVGKGVSYCATCDGMLYRGRKVAVIGFGPADKEEAEYLEGIGCLVSYYEKPRKVEIRGEEKVNCAVIDGEETQVEGVFILRPSLAPSDLFPGIELDGNYIRVNRDMETNLQGLFAAGDCTGTPLQVAKAVGEGMIAGQKAMAYVKSTTGTQK